MGIFTGSPRIYRVILNPMLNPYLNNYIIIFDTHFKSEFHAHLYSEENILQHWFQSKNPIFSKLDRILRRMRLEASKTPPNVFKSHFLALETQN